VATYGYWLEEKGGFVFLKPIFFCFFAIFTPESDLQLIRNKKTNTFIVG